MRKKPISYLFLWTFVSDRIRIGPVLSHSLQLLHVLANLLSQRGEGLRINLRQGRLRVFVLEQSVHVILELHEVSKNNEKKFLKLKQKIRTAPDIETRRVDALASEHSA